jgi:hypothetical protein
MEKFPSVTRNTVDYFDEKAGRLGVFTYYGKEFFDDIEKHFKNKVENTYRSLMRKLIDDINDAKKLLNSTLKFRAHIKIKIRPIELQSPETPWDSIEDFIASIIVFRLFLPFTFLQKDIRKNEVKEFCDENINIFMNKIKEDTEQLKHSLEILP